MPTLEQRSTSTLVKAINIGDSGSGKTAALASLARAGYEVFILDFDNGTDILLDPSVLAPEFRHKIIVETLTDKMVKGVNGPVCQDPKAARNGVNLLTKWKEYGAVDAWGPNRVLVIDSITAHGTASLNWVRKLNMRVGQGLRINDWGDAISMQERMLQLLYSDEVKCHVIVNAHITYQGGDDASVDMGIKGWPSALGSKFPPKVGRLFSMVVRTSSIGSGTNEKRYIQTQSSPVIELKNPMPSLIEKRYGINEGWEKIFAAVTGNAFAPKVEG